MVAMLSRMCSMLRQDGHQQWGFWLQGGRDQGLPITINRVADNTIAEVRGLRCGDTVLQIGRERTIDMTHVDAQNAVKRAGNRLDILILRPANQEQKNTVSNPIKEDRVPIRAIVYKQTNSPIGLYSAENVADTFIEQTKVLTKGAVRLQRNPVTLKSNISAMQKSDVYRMVHEEDSSGKSSPPSSPQPTIRSYHASGASTPTFQSQSFNKLRQSLYDDSDEYTSSSSNSPTPMYRKQQPAPAPPPKPVAGRPEPQHHHQANHQQQQPQRQQPSPQQQHQQQRQQPSPQQQHQPQRQQPSPQQQPQRQQPPPQQQHQPQRQQPPPQQQQQQRPQQQQQQNNYQPQQQYQQQQHYQQQQQFYRREEEEDYNDRPKYQPYPQVTSQSRPVQPNRPSSTFQTNIPFVQNSSPSPQPHEGSGVTQIQWSPTTGRRRPIWPPPKSDSTLSTSSQSVKWAGGRPSKQFIWPPPKDFVEVTEDIQGNQRSVIYRHVPENEANKSKVFVSSRAPARLAAVAWEPYTQSYEGPAWLKGSSPSKRLRRFDDIFSSNSTRLPPTYRAPPGTFHVATDDKQSHKCACPKQHEE